MGKTTPIEWCDSTLSLLIGCDGCELSAAGHCYAEQLVSRYKGMKGWPEAFGKPAIFMYRLDAALKWPDLTGQPRPDKPWLDGRPRMIFVNDLGDTFTESLPLDWIAPAIDRMAAGPHIWLMLTKRPRRAWDFVWWYREVRRLEWPANVWIGTSVTSAANVGRMHDLARILGVRRFASFEPLLGPVQVPYGVLSGCLFRCTDCDHYYRPERPDCHGTHGPNIDWLIIGGESGRSARPCDVAWIRSLRDQGQAAKVPVFVKQLGSLAWDESQWLKQNRIGDTNREYNRYCRVKLRHPKGGDWSEWPERLRVREVPR